MAELIRWADQVILQGIAHDIKESTASVTTLIRAVLDGIKVTEPGPCWVPTDLWSSFFSFWNVRLFTVVAVVCRLSMSHLALPAVSLVLVLSQTFCLSLLLHSPAAPLCHVRTIHVCGLGSWLFGVLLECEFASSRSVF